MEFDERLVQYVLALQAAGQTYSQIVMTLCIEQGYALLVAQRIVDSVLVYGGNQGSLLTPPKIDLPIIDTTSRTSVIELPDARAPIIFEQLVPRVVVMDDFVTARECDALCDLVTPRFQPSTVAGKPVSAEDLAKMRSSETAHVGFRQTPEVARIEARIEALTSWPQTMCEPLQIQRYLPGKQYLPHFDHFDPNQPDFADQLAFGGQRVATLIIYLRTPDSGGATYFAGLGLRVAPRRGSALFFSYPEPIISNGLLHGGERVVSGEKWIATKWFRREEWRGRPHT
jgi:prolyl 4-hydroxylase